MWSRFVVGAVLVVCGVVAGTSGVGRVEQSFPLALNPLPDRELAVGQEMRVDVASIFVGAIHTYTATSSDTATVTAAADGPVVTIVGVVAGTATVTVLAADDSGYAADDFTVTVTPPLLSVMADSPGWCLGSEGVLAPGGRRGFGSVDVTYEVSGGVGPYTITSPDAPGAVHSAPSGAITVSCARDGRDPAPVSPRVNLVEAGPRTIRVDVTDSIGATAHAEILIEVAENAYTSEYNGGIMCAGRTYVLGDPDPGDWVLLTLPPGLYMRFRGLSPNGMAHFEEIRTGSEITLDWHTGEELHRTIRSEENDGADAIIAARCPESTD